MRIRTTDHVFSILHLYNRHRRSKRLATTFSLKDTPKPTSTRSASPAPPHSQSSVDEGEEATQNDDGVLFAVVMVLDWEAEGSLALLGIVG